MSEIVKVQLPVSTSGVANPQPLIYDKYKRHSVMQPIDLGTKRALRGDMKGYFRAEWVERVQQWFIAERVADQEW